MPSNKLNASPDSGPRTSSQSWYRVLFYWPVVGLIAAFVLLISAEIMRHLVTAPPWLMSVTISTSLLIALLSFVFLIRQLNRQILDPLTMVRDWAARLHEGRYSERLPDPMNLEMSGLVRDLNDLGDELRSLNLEMAARVRRQTQHLARKTRSLEILYDVASTLSKTRTLEELLENFLDTFVQLFDARAAMVRLVTDSGQLRLVASRGLDASVIDRERLMPLDRCLCGKTAQTGSVLIQKGILPCAQVLGVPLLANDSRELVSVPIQYHDQTLGVYNLVLDKPISDFGDDLSDLLTSIGRHLGIAVEKANLDEHSRRLAIIEERNMIGNELHDSLAQSLVSMRLHVKMLGEMMYKRDMHSAQNEVRRLHMALEEAHTSLRELLANFRSRMDERGLIPAIEDMIMRFEEETGIASYFQNETRSVSMDTAHEIQIFRIIQEALANIRKHSDAHTARILLRDDGQGNYQLLIEDDGLGISSAAPTRRGEKVGLEIMRERAERIGGSLHIESEAGEGTRILLSFTTTGQSTPGRATGT